MKAAEWNEKYPAGTEVMLLDDAGLTHVTKTRSSAWDLGYGPPVVLVEGRSGGYDLSRIKPTKTSGT